MAPPSPDGIRIHNWQAVFLYLGDVAVIGAIAGLCQTVFLICDGQFETSMVMNGPVETEQFDRPLYLLAEADDFAICLVKFLLFERSKRLAAIELTPHPGSNDDDRVTQFTAT